MILFSIIISSMFIFPLNSYGLDEDVFTIFAVSCEDNVELLDYKEFYSMYPSYNHDIVGESHEVLMGETLSRLSGFAQGRSIVFQNWFENISKKVRFVRNINLGQHSDNLGFLNWDGCQIKQLAKALNINNEGKTLIIDEELWERMDAKSQVGVYLNYFLNIEYVLYRDKETTVNTRYFNGLLSSNHFIKIKPKLYPYIYESILDFNKISFYGMFFEIRGYASPGERTYSVEFNSSGKLIRGKFEFNDFHFFKKPNIIKLRFINAPNFNGEIGSSYSFRPDANGVFSLESYKTGKGKLCLGKLKIESGKYLNLKLNFKNGKSKIISATGLFQYKGMVYSKIIFENHKFSVLNSSLTEIRDDFREIKVGICE